MKNVYQRKDGRFEARISIGKDSIGKRLYRSVCGKSRAEVELKLSAMGSCEYSVTEMTVKELTIEYLSAVKPRLKESAFANYRLKAEKHIIPAFGNKCCSSLNADDVYAFIEEKRRKGLSARYIADIVVLLKSIFRYGIDEIAEIEIGIYAQDGNYDCKHRIWTHPSRAAVFEKKQRFSPLKPLNLLFFTCCDHL